MLYIFGFGIGAIKEIFLALIERFINTVKDNSASQFAASCPRTGIEFYQYLFQELVRSISHGRHIPFVFSKVISSCCADKFS